MKLSKLMKQDPGTYHIFCVDSATDFMRTVGSFARRQDRKATTKKLILLDPKTLEAIEAVKVTVL